MKVIEVSEDVQMKLQPILERRQDLIKEVEQLDGYYRELLSSMAKFYHLDEDEDDMWDFSEDGRYLVYEKAPKSEY